MQSTSENPHGAAPVYPCPPWIVLVKHWKRIFFLTGLGAAAAVATALLWPETYRSVALILVTPPTYSKNLVIPPKPLDMKTLDSLARSYQVLQKVITKIRCQRDWILQARSKLDESGRDNRTWDHVAGLSWEAAADLIGEEKSPEFREAWEDLPPADLLPGYLEFQDDDFEEVDPLVISEYLKTRIQTKLENRLRVEYQPVLTLTADWCSPRTAAILAYEWARSFLRAFEEEYLAPTLARQEKVLESIRRVQADLEQAITALEDYKAESEYHTKVRELLAAVSLLNRSGPEEKSLSALAEDVREKVPSLYESAQVSVRNAAEPGSSTGEACAALEDFYSNLALSDALEDQVGSMTRRIQRLGEEIVASEAELDRLNRNLESLQDEYDYVLEEAGGVEALSEDYRRTFRVGLLEIPVPPKRRIRPRRSVIVLATAAVVFFAVCLMTLVEDQYRRFRSSNLSA